MPKLLRVRELTAAERAEAIGGWRTAAPPRRGWWSGRASSGCRRRAGACAAIAAEVGCHAQTVRLLAHALQRRAGWRAWRTRRAPGGPATYTPEQVGAVVAAALTDPQALGLPFGAGRWTGWRRTSTRTAGIAIKRSRIEELLLAEGLRWRQQETWFGERVDPDFAAKRGPS